MSRVQPDTNLVRWQKFVRTMQATLLECHSWNTAVNCHRREAEVQAQASEANQTGDTGAAINSDGNNSDGNNGSQTTHSDFPSAAGEVTAAISSPDAGLLQVFVQWSSHHGDYWNLCNCELRAIGCATTHKEVEATEALLKEIMRVDTVSVTHVDHD